VGKGRRVFVATHKKLKPILQTYETPFEMSAGHYGKINGSNKWQDFDTCVIFGLPHLPDTWSPNVFMAHQGEQSEEWLNDENHREFNNKQDIRKALKHGQMVVTVVQAINRVRCRRVINHWGECPPATVYLLIPNGPLGDDIVEGIKQEMPGIKVRGWDYRSQKRKPKRSQVLKGLISYLEIMEEGRVSPTQLAKELGTNLRTIQRLLTKDDLHHTMKQLSVRYEVVRVGKKQQAYFVKV
jgi:hypothetical protein